MYNFPSAYLCLRLWRNRDRNTDSYRTVKLVFGDSPITAHGLVAASGVSSTYPFSSLALLTHTSTPRIIPPSICTTHAHTHTHAHSDWWIGFSCIRIIYLFLSRRCKLRSFKSQKRTPAHTAQTSRINLRSYKPSGLVNYLLFSL